MSQQTKKRHKLLNYNSLRRGRQTNGEGGILGARPTSRFCGCLASEHKTIFCGGLRVRHKTKADHTTTSHTAQVAFLLCTKRAQTGVCPAEAAAVEKSSAVGGG